MAWQRSELNIARRFAACRGLSRDALEDLYQETTLALMQRPYFDEDHLRAALRWGLTHRALRAYRDETRHAQIIQRHAREAEPVESSRSNESDPETSMLVHEDLLVAAEFLCELDSKEQEVFGLVAEGMSYWAIATAKDCTIAEARKLVRSCERKRMRLPRRNHQRPPPRAQHQRRPR
jgi:RNA polymerase sigma factor (sigma-70 family)